MSKYILVLSLVLTSLFLADSVIADGNCSTSYGQEVCVPNDLNINKMVQDPKDGVYVENVTTPKFSQGDKVIFKLIVKNNSGETQKNVRVTDGVPENLVIDDADMNYVNSDGKKDITISSDKKNVEFKINELTAGREVTLFVWTHLVGPYPAEDSFCRDNWAVVRSDQRPNDDRNFARFCVQSKISGAKTLPAAGVNDLVLVIPFALSGLGGLALLKKRK